MTAAGSAARRAVSFNRVVPAGRELEYVREAVEASRLGGDGPFTRKCERLLEGAIGAPRALLTGSCTSALEMAALLLDLAPGDEVIVPTFTFVSSANAFALRGAKPRFADIRPDTLNLDEARLGELVTERTRAIVVMHYAGVACEMEAIRALAKERGIPIVEDNAHGLFGSRRGAPLGAFGELSTLSFHETKNITCGEGGALLVNDPRFADRAEIVREKGTNRSRFFRGQVDKYTWVDLGSSYLASELQAAFLYGQLEEREKIQKKRHEIWSRYFGRLGGWAKQEGIALPTVPEGDEQPAHLFYMLLPDLASRTRLIEHLKALGVPSAFHYIPLHLSEMGRHFGGRPGDCPVAESASDRLLRLPFHSALDEQDLDYVVDCVTSFRV